MSLSQGVKTRNEIEKYVIAYIAEHGYPPTFREIGNAVGLRSTSSVQKQIKTMIRTGVFETDADEGTPRALRVPGYRFCKID